MSLPKSDIDLFSDHTLLNTEAVYRDLRALGPMVHLPKNDLYAVTSFDAVRNALRADSVLLSGHGVAANDVINGVDGHATIVSDGDVHTRRRAVLMRPLMPGALKTLRAQIDDTADRLVRELLARGTFDAVTDFAAHLPLSIVVDLVGLDEAASRKMLGWAAATFNALGPMNSRTEHALEVALELVGYVKTLGPDTLKPGSWAQRPFFEIETGSLSPPEAAMMVVDYVAPSLDTTILASAHMLWRLAITPGAFDAMKADQDLIRGIVNESVRLASPIRSFTRYAGAAYETDHGSIPKGKRAAILYASANWDDGHYAQADQFKTDRNPRDHVGWGHGAHSCAGMHLARMEMEALARALARHVRELGVGTPVPLMNNLLQGFQALPAWLR
ncbi:MAG: cytochrome P450 [Pseudomonadota bacterium]